MSGTALDHPLVQDYIRRLENALLRLPAKQAVELREQLTAHLDDALHSDVSDEEVSAVLSRLGRPEELVSEAGPGPRSVERPILPGPRAWLRGLARLRWRGWSIIVASLAALAAIIGYTIVPLAGVPLTAGSGDYSWWYAQDRLHSRDTYPIFGEDTTEVRVRSGQRQGLFLPIYNPSNLTVEVLGPGPEFITPGGLEGQVALATTNPLTIGSQVQGLRYQLPVIIPPHQTRILRELWTSTVCISPGAATAADSVSLRVRVGWIIRDENVPFHQGFALKGPSTGQNSAGECV
ncbi:MAG TPA: hypothetical protein VGI64_17405 [Streptosporangiaceae bacterium]|jgi:hypothetical protein